MATSPAPTSGRAIRVLFTAWNSYAAVDPASGVAVGGLETFAWGLARQLAAQPGCEVIYCVRTAVPPPEDKVDRVQLVANIDRWRAMRVKVNTSVEQIARFPWLRFRQWRWPLMWQVPLLALRRVFGRRVPWLEVVRSIVEQVQPDVIVAFGVNEDSSTAIEAGREAAVPVILWLQSNGDLDPRFFEQGESYRDPYGVTSEMARICLQQATLIVCQTEWQQERLQDVAGTRNVVIRNPVDTDRFHPGQQGFSGRRGVLWIGRYDHTHKRPLLALEIARRCPHLDFTLVINRRSGDDDVRREVMADRLQNVCIQDYVPHSAMPELLRTCKVFMSTGSREYEGFPNVFLEAAASGTPVCALEDFGGFLARWQCGACSQGDLESLARQVRTLHDDAELWNRCSRSGRRAVLSQHSLPEVARQFTDVLRTVVHQPLAPQPLNDNQLPR